MMIARCILIGAAALSAGTALAQEATSLPPFDTRSYPIEVQKALHQANEECASQGGGQITFALNTVRKLDLTGDGTADYIVSFGNTECAGRAAVFCGSGGCLINILVTLPNGGVRKVFDDYVRGYDIRPKPSEKSNGPRTVRFELHGAFCGGHGTPSCFKEMRITAKPFEFKMPQ